MEGALAATGGGGGGGGPAPFLVKTYDMVDDSATDHIVSWSPSRTSFVVWNPPEFSRLLLPTYFKHNNFSSFIRQLNTYGFHKIDPEKWEFANDDFVKDKKHLLKNIYRRKPIHSHSQPPADPERVAFAEEIDKLTRETAELGSRLKLQQQKSPAKSLVENLRHRVTSLDERQKNLLDFFKKAVQNPDFVEHLSRKIESMDLSAYAKKRRLPQAHDDHHFELPGENNNFSDNRSISRPDVGNIFQEDISNRLRLELSPALLDRNLVSSSTHSSNEDMGSSPRKSSEDEQGNVQVRTDTILQIASETIDLTDTGASLSFKMDSSLSLRAGTNESLVLHPRHQNLVSGEEGEGHISCQLNLSLASSPFQANPVGLSAEDARGSDIRSDITNAKSSEVRGASMDKNSRENGASLSSSRESQNGKGGGNAAQPVRVNDVFWEQFLTERPGASDNEEASSNYRSIPYEEQQDDRGVSKGMSKTAKNLGKLSL